MQKKVFFKSLRVLPSSGCPQHFLNGRISSVYAVLRMTKLPSMAGSSSVNLSADHLDTETSGDYLPVGFEQCAVKYGTYSQVAHAMPYCRNQHSHYRVDGETVSQPASILMHLRFDGYLGFPGGIVEPGEEVWTGLRRELVEELGLDAALLDQIKRYPISSHVNHRTQLCVHFYTLEVACNGLEAVEKTMLSARDYGSEVLGPVRVPLYTMADKLRGLPLFLQNKFIGNTRDQLLYSIEKLGFLTVNEIYAVKNKP